MNFNFTYYLVILSISIILLQFNKLKSQEFDEERYFEHIAQETEEIPALEMIEYLRINKINLLNTTPEDLSQIPGMDLIMADRIISLVRIKNVRTITEISRTLSLPLEIEILMREICYFRAMPRKPTVHYRSRYRERFQDTRGMRENIYKGSSFDLYNRLLLSESGFFGGILSKKEPGEKFEDSFLSFHAGYEGKNFKIVAGDYAITSGMGMLLWSPFSQNKSWDAIYPALQKGSGIQPWRSSLQHRFFRGTAIEGDIFLTNDVSLQLIGFASKKSLAATYDKENDAISSIYVSGIFRTENEITKMNAVDELNLGLNAEFKTTSISLGLNTIFTEFSKTIQAQSIATFNGKAGLASSIYTFYRLYGFMFGAEAGFDANMNLGTKLGTICRTEVADFAAHYRNYSQSFRSPYGNNFGEFYNPANEQGLYFGLRIRVNPYTAINSYIDFFSSHGRTYSVPTVVKGSEKMFEFSYRGFEQTEISFKARHKEITDRIESIDNLRHIIQKEKYQLRADIVYYPISGLLLKLRFENVIIDFDGKKDMEVGYCTFLEMKYALNSVISFGARFSLFDTDSYQSAIWQFEYVMPGYTNSPALFDSGSRSFIYLSYKPYDFLSLRIRYQNLNKNFTRTLGTAYDVINSNVDSRVFVSLEFTL